MFFSLFLQPRDLDVDTKSVQSYEEAPPPLSQPITASTAQTQEAPIQSSSPVPVTETQPPPAVSAGRETEEEEVDEFGYSMGR